MNALWLWRNRNGRVSFWWELLHWMNNLCNCCLLVCRAWILPDRCVWTTVSDCGDCTNTSCSASPLKLSEYLLKWSSLRPWSFPRQGVQAECLGHAGSASVPSCTLCSALRDSSPLPSLIWHLYFTDVTTCLDWPKMPTQALAKRQLSSTLAASACFPFQKQSGAYDPDSDKDLFHLTSVIQAFRRKGKERMWSLKIFFKTCQTRVWLARN